MLGRGKCPPVPSEVFIPIQAFENLSIIFQDFPLLHHNRDAKLPQGGEKVQNSSDLGPFVPDVYIFLLGMPAIL